MYVLLIFALMGCAAGAPTPLLDRIKHVVVVMEENRSFDHLLGWYKGVNGLTGQEFNRVDTTDPRSKQVFVSKNASQVGRCDPNHGVPETTAKIFGAKGNVPSMDGFVEFESSVGHASTNYCGVMDMFPPERMPVMSALASEYVVMDRFFASVPGPTWPNRVFCVAATSSGMTGTGVWYNDVPGAFFPHKTVFDQVADAGGTWRVYYNDTPWELMVATVAHNPDSLLPMDAFYADARAGTLPTFSWINPRSGINMSLGLGSNDQHPDHDVALGEAFYKDIYEALRASPAWNDTLMIITYDEHGGFYDHEPTPLDVPPPGDTNHSSYPDPFAFDRLGVRLPTLLISPWLQRGAVQSAPPDAQKPAVNSEYELTSIMASMRKLLRPLTTTGPLTRRDAWAATFEHLFGVLDAPRTDCPMHLPDPMPPAHMGAEAEAAMPPNGLQQDILAWHAHLSGQPYPSHITRQGDVSSWLQQALTVHRRLHSAWQRSKVNASYTVVAHAQGVGSFTQWKVQSSGAQSTISTDINQTEYCMDGGSMTEGSVATLSACWPMSRPSHNSDDSQQWALLPDATIRPLTNTTLCLTSALYGGASAASANAVLSVCKNDVSQHFGYFGSAPGNGGDTVWLGAYASTLGVKEQQGTAN